MSEITSFFTDLAKNHWTRVSGLIAALVLVVLVLVPVFGQLNFENISRNESLFLVATLAAVAILWMWSNRVPRHPKDSVGIDVVIAVEDVDYAKRLREDFVHQLEKLLGKGVGRHPLHLRIHPGHRYATLKDEAAATEFVRKTRGHFVIYGRARERHVGGEDSHVLELEGLVVHKRVQEEIHDQLRKEFVEVFPRRLIVAKENDLFSLEITAGWIDVAARYVVALASMISGDLDYAESILVNLEGRLNQDGDLPPNLAKIKNRVPLRIAEVLKSRLNGLYHQYYLKRDIEHLRTSVEVLDRLDGYDPNYYSGKLHRAICLFELERDVDGALEVLDSCNGNPDTTWRYSKAFLLAYDGRMDEASEQLRHAVRNPPNDSTVPIQSEEFIHRVLEAEPDRAQLYFLLGVINHKAKKDAASARRDFEAFLAQNDPDDYSRQRALARKWMGQIDRQLRYAEEPAA